MPDYTPNPLNSYYDGGTSSAALSVPPGVSAMLGSPRGGFNPTNDEYWRRKMMTSERERFMSDVYRTDPRTMAASAMLQHQLFGQESKDRQAFMRKIGGPGNFNEMVGWALNHPSVSGLTGGSVHSLATGALGAMSGGMTMGGQGMYGDHQVSLMGARHLMQRVNSQFYGSSGSSNLAATQGLSRDQIGGMMMSAGSQGAFAGLDIGKLVNNGGLREFRANDASLTKITDFTKTAAKFLSGLIDVFGNGSVSQLLGKAQAITGLDLSRIENAGVINSRLQSLRNTGNVYGMDTASVYGLAQAGTAAGLAMGLHPAAAGAFSHQATTASLSDFASRKLMGGSLYLPSVSPQELMMTRHSEMTQMTLTDPMGQLRMATELMFENGHGTPDQQKMIRERMAAARPGEDLKLASYIGETLGRHPMDVIFKYGGPGGVAKALSAGGMDRAIAGGESDLQERQENIMRMRFSPEVYKRLTTESMNALAGSSDPYITSAIKEMQGNPMLASYRSRVDRDADARRMFLASGGSLSSKDRGLTLQGGIAQGIAQGMMQRLEGVDPGSVYQMASAFGGKSILGLAAGTGFSLDPDLLGKDSEMASKSFYNLRKAVELMDHGDNRRYGGTKLLQTLGIGSGQTVIDQNLVMEKLRNPATMAEINRNWNVFTDPEGMTQLVPKALQDRLAPHGKQIAQMRGAAEILKQTGYVGFAGMLEGVAKGGSKEDMDKRMELFHNRITDKHVLSEFTPDDLKKLSGGAHGGLGRDIANALEVHKAQYAAVFNADPKSAEGQFAEKKLKHIETQLAALREGGNYTDGDLGVTKLTGRLIMQSASGQELGVADLRDAQITGKKGK